ncbi:MAG: hydrogenase, partial [Verrucomicrobia bacterium]|nr:hydrogenase [Verrucomicrobiota bacterium]
MQNPHAQPDENVVLRGRHSYDTVEDKIASIVLTRKLPIQWFIGFGIGFTLLMLFLFSATVLLMKGVGVWGLNVPVAWGFAIINFVWWIGIGHAGTLISAILL